MPSSQPLESLRSQLDTLPPEELILALCIEVVRLEGRAERAEILLAAHQEGRPFIEYDPDWKPSPDVGLTPLSVADIIGYAQRANVAQKRASPA